MKYVLVAVAVFLIVVVGMLAREGLLKKDNFLELIGKRQLPRPEVAEQVVVPSVGGSIAEKLATREQELEERALLLEEQANQVTQERAEFEKLRAEVDQKLKTLQGEIDGQGVSLELGCERLGVTHQLYNDVHRVDAPN